MSTSEYEGRVTEIETVSDLGMTNANESQTVLHTLNASQLSILRYIYSLGNSISTASDVK